MKKLLLLILAIPMLFSSCSSTGMKHSGENKIEIGMTQGQVRSIMGRPDSFTKYTVNTIWVYKEKKPFALAGGLTLGMIPELSEAGKVKRTVVVFSNETGKLIGWN